MISRPSQKLGTARKMVMPTRDTWSAQVLRNQALSRPMGTPNSHDSTTAKMAIWAEMGPRRRIIWLMGSLVQKEYPISPLNT